MNKIMSSCSELLAERGPQADEEVSLAPGRQFDGCEVNDGSGVDRIVEIERLASLDSLDYEVAREAAAKRLGIRTSALDKEVKAKRQALGLDKDHASDDGQGRPVQIVDVLPWHTAVDGDMLAAALSGAIRNYVVLPDTSADAIALWVMHSWMVDAFTVSPRLAVYSPTKGCGKTTLLGVVSKLVKRPKFTGSISPAALFRLVETFQPTLLIDELKKFLELGSELHGILNEGHGRGVHVLRVLGEKKELREFRVFGAVAFGTLGRVPDDLEDRSIIVRLQRRRAEEEVCEFRPDRAENLEQLARWCARWAEDNARHIEDLDPEVSGLMNRAADNWRPLFAIAACIGGDWPSRVQEAAAALADYDDESAITMLLIDIKAMFEETDTDRLASTTICDKLAAIEGRPWADWRNGKPITPNQLARLLKPFGIASDTIRMVGGAAKGYWRHVFSDAFNRYFPETPPCEPLHRNKCDEIRGSYTFQSVTSEPAVTFRKSQKPNNDGDCYGVTLCEEGRGLDEHLCAYCGNRARNGAPLLDAFDAGREVRLHEHCLLEYMELGIPDFLRRTAGQA